MSAMREGYYKLSTSRHHDEQMDSESKSGISFVMTVWLEPQKTEGPPEWRWHVRHIQSGEERHFRRLEAVLDYIGETANTNPPV